MEHQGAIIRKKNEIVWYLVASMPIVYDKLIFSRTRPPPSSYIEGCTPLHVEDLSVKRPPLRVYSSESREHVIGSGCSNEINEVTIWRTDRSTPGKTVRVLCSRVALRTRREKYPMTQLLFPVHEGLSNKEIRRAVSMGYLEIGPAIYAVTSRALLMERFDMDLMTYLQTNERITKKQMEMISKSLAQLVQRIVNHNLLCLDMKPENVVVKVDPTTRLITSIRLIDFDNDSCTRKVVRAWRRSFHSLPVKELHKILGFLMMCQFWTRSESDNHESHLFLLSDHLQRWLCPRFLYLKRNHQYPFSRILKDPHLAENSVIPDDLREMARILECKET